MSWREPPRGPTVTRTIHNHGCQRRQWAPRASQQAFQPAPMPPLDREATPSKRIYNFVGIKGGVWPPKMLQCCSDASSLPKQRSALRAIDPLNPRKNYIRLLGGMSSINPNHWAHELGPTMGR